MYGQGKASKCRMQAGKGRREGATLAPPGTPHLHLDHAAWRAKAYFRRLGSFVFLN